MESFRNAIIAVGLDPPLDIPPKQWVRFPGYGKGNGNKAGYAFLFEDGLGGLFGDFSSDLSEVWRHDKVSSFTPDEMVDFKAMVEESRIEAKKQKEQEYDKGAEKAHNDIQGLKNAKSTHPYLKTKKVKPHGLLIQDDNLLMPLTNLEGKLTSYQTITPDGIKKLMYGGKKKGSAYHIKGQGTRTYVVEGFATGATVHEATGNNVFVAVDAGNMGIIVEGLVEKEYKDIIIAADNDHSTENNTGVVKAKEIALKFKGVSVTYPPELPDRLSTDWNDFAEARGIGTVAKLLMPKKVKGITVAKIMATDYPEIKWAVPGIIPEGLTVLAGSPKLGKSYGVLGLAYSISIGGLAWGFANTNKASVYYLALEDSERRIQSRVNQMEGHIDEYPDNLHIYTDFPRINEGLLEEFDRIKEQDKNIGLIIIDTLQKVRPVSNGKRMIYQAEYEDYEKLQRWGIKNGIAVVCVHHTRKGDPTKELNPFDAVSGSTGIQGVADTLIVCVRPKGTSEGTMYVTGREVVEEEYKIVFSRETMTWHIEAPVDIDGVVEKAEGQSFDSWFANNDSITIKEACKLWNTSQCSARKRLEELVEGGEYAKEKMPHEGPGRPQYKYYPKDKEPKQPKTDKQTDKPKLDPWS